MVGRERGMELLGQTDLGGRGDAMQVLPYRDLAYVGHLGNGGTDVVDLRHPRQPVVVGNLPAPSGTHSHKVQIGNGLLLVNRERWKDAVEWTAGVDIYDLDDPVSPRLVTEWRTTGSGVHRMWLTDESPLAYISASVPGFTDRILLILDLSDPSHPAEIGRWWFPGMNQAAGEIPSWEGNRRCVCHHAVVRGDRAYVGWWDLGMVILDVADPTRPSLVAHLDWSEEGGGATHTVLPIGRWLAVADEAIAPAPEVPEKRIRLIDVADERNPRIHAVFPEPPDAAEHRTPGLRFGPHNLHENRIGTFQSDTRLFGTYYSGGLRGYEVSSDGRVVETSYLVPPAPAEQDAVQTNDLVVRADGVILFTDRLHGGLYTASLS